MGLVDDIFKALDRIPIWARLQEVPSEVDQLKAKVAALEEKLDGKWPADVCRYCGERAVRLANAFGEADTKGYMREEWRCEKCERMDVKAYKPGAR